jgi:glycogen debranching enzyme
MRYGFVEEAQRIALGLIDAADLLNGRLPELFSGFDREEFPSPVPYPTSCEPQAWAAAAPLYLLRTLLRFDPWVPFGRVWCDPAVPAPLLPLTIQGVHLAGARVGVEVTADDWRLEGLPPGVELVERPRDPLRGEEAAS